MQKMDIKHKRHFRRLERDKAYRQNCMARLYERKMGYKPDLKNPKRLSERLLALYLRSEDPLCRELVRKSAQMELLRARRQDKWIVRTWGSAKRFRDVRWKDMPEKFVLVPDHLPGEGEDGPGQRTDRTQKGWKAQAKRAFRRWMKANGFVLYGIPEYAFAAPRVLIEEDREGREICVLCMDGNVCAMYWKDEPENVMDAFGAPMAGQRTALPDDFAEISAFCREISTDFPFMKINLLVCGGQSKCASLSLGEDAAFFHAISKELDEELGSMLKIPNA